jgi:hypothetical protein
MPIPKSKVRFCIIIPVRIRHVVCGPAPINLQASAILQRNTLLNGNTINGIRGVPGSKGHDAASRGHSGKAMRHQ